MQINPTDQVLWYLNKSKPQPLRHNLTVDVAIVGGGMAGLTAAQAFKNKGCTVALLEKYFCGAGASGKSSGFITPDSEYSLQDLTNKYNKEQAKKLWEFALGGVKHIRDNIETFALSCDYQKEDTLVVANSPKSFRDTIEPEYHVRTELSYGSTLYKEQDLTTILGSQGYAGGIRYGGSFGINAYLYCQGMKAVLQEQAIDIYEETPVLAIKEGELETPYARVKAGTIILCTDRFTPELGILKKDIYHAQTFLLVSAPLNPEHIRMLFPEKNLMVWDTELIYTYYRIVEGNRLLVGGSSLLATYASQAQYHNTRVMHKLEKYIKSKFPQVPLVFEYKWPGLIGITKDIMPIAGWVPGYDRVYCISGAAGLPWAAALALYSAEHAIDKRADLDAYFSPTRSFPIGHFAQTFLGTRLTFALANFQSLPSF